MDLPNLARNIDKLAATDIVVADSYLRYAFRKCALYVLACLLAMMGIALLGLALYWLLEQSLGPIAAAALVGMIGCLIAAIVAVIALVQRPGREFSVAMEMRRSTLAALEQDVGAPSPSAATYLYPASEALVSSVILPLISALLRSLKSARNKPAETASNSDIAKTAPPLVEEEKA